MAFQLSNDINIEYTPAVLHDTPVALTSVTLQIDSTLTARGRKIFRSRKYNPKRSVHARFNSKPGRPKKLKQVPA